MFKEVIMLNEGKKTSFANKLPEEDYFATRQKEENKLSSLNDVKSELQFLQPKQNSKKQDSCDSKSSPPLRKSLNSTRNQHEELLENEENYYSTNMINERVDLDDTNSQTNRSQMESFVGCLSRFQQGSILPINQTIDPKLHLSSINYTQEEHKLSQSYDYATRNITNQNDKTINIELIQENKEEEDDEDEDEEEDDDEEESTSRKDKGAQLVEQNSQHGSQFKNSLKQRYSLKKDMAPNRRSSLMQSENLYCALQQITSKNGGQPPSQKNNENSTDAAIGDSKKSCNKLPINQSSSLNQINQSDASELQNKPSISKEQPEKMETQKSALLNIQNLKKKEDKIKEILIRKIGQFTKFFRSIKYLSASYKYRIMSLEQKEKFNDLSFYFSKKKQVTVNIDGKRVYSRYFQKCLSKIANFIPVFNPFHFAIITIEILVLIILITQIFVLPLADSFNVDMFQGGVCKVIFYTFPSFFLTIAIILKFNTGYLKENVVIRERKKIIVYYYNNGFLIEFISLISIIINQFTQHSYVYFFFLLRLNLVESTLSKIDNRFSLTQRVPHFLQIIKLIFLALLLAHINGCIFNYIARDLDESWLTKNSLTGTDWHVRYINSVYFSFITMVTVGYGDITPVSIQEKIFVICMCVYSCGAFGYIVSSIGNIFTERQMKQANYKTILLLQRKRFLRRYWLTYLLFFYYNIIHILK